MMRGGNFTIFWRRRYVCVNLRVPNWRVLMSLAFCTQPSSILRKLCPEPRGLSYSFATLWANLTSLPIDRIHIIQPTPLATKHHFEGFCQLRHHILNNADLYAFKSSIFTGGRQSHYTFAGYHAEESFRPAPTVSEGVVSRLSCWSLPLGFC